LHPALAAIFTGNGSGVCASYAGSYGVIPGQADQYITIPKSAAVGDPLGNWRTNDRATYLYSSGGVGKRDMFSVCAPWQSIASAPTSGTEDYLWVTGEKHPSVYESPDVSSVFVDGNSYTVWTTDALSDAGVGFILRWRAQARGLSKISCSGRLV